MKCFLLILLLGVTAGALFAESIRETIHILDPNKPGTPEEGSENGGEV